MYEKLKKKQVTNFDILLIFLFAFFIRICWTYFSGLSVFANPDWNRYNLQSDEILTGNFNLETQLFITAPLFSYLVAGFKFIFSQNYVEVLCLFQLLISSLSVIFLVKTAILIFKNPIISKLTGLSFSIYPITFYWVNQFGQETLFQALLIIGLYYLVSFLNYKSLKSIFLASLILSLAALTKSHIIMMLPLIAIIIFMAEKTIGRSFYYVTLFYTIMMLMFLPYGLYNYYTNGIYVFSSTGLGGHFLLGHNEDIYKYIVEPPQKGTLEYNRITSMDFDIFRELKPELENTTHAMKQSIYLKAGFQWFMENPTKSAKLAFQNTINFITPGFNRKHYEFYPWLLAFLFSLPVFILAYFEIVRRTIENWRAHTIIWSLFLTMLAFSLIFYSQNRFRVVTIEPWYLMYACSGLVFIFDRYCRSALPARI